MKESELKEFLEGDLDVLQLELALGDEDEPGAFTEDLDGEVVLTCDDLVKLCDAHLHGVLSLDALRSVAAGVLCSDHFAWDETSEGGELVATVLWEWSSDDDEDTLTSAKVAEQRKTLSGGSKG